MLSTRTVANQTCELTNKFSIRQDLLPDGVRSLKEGLNMLLNDEVSFPKNITTPSGTALGGDVKLSLRANGSYTFSGHMHDSGWDPYDFRIRLIFTYNDSKTALAMQHSGHVDGTGSDFLDPNRDNNWNETDRDFQLNIDPNLAEQVRQKIRLIIRKNWLQVGNGNLDVRMEYEDVGLLGGLETLIVDVLKFFVTALVVSPYGAIVIFIGSELAKAFEIDYTSSPLGAGIFVAAGMVWVFGPGMLIPATVTGAVIASSIKMRHLNDSEKEEVNKVFHNTIPLDRIVITNLSNGGRFFVLPNIDGSILVNMGDLFDHPEQSHPPSYPSKYQVLIHELTHAWQIEHLSTPSLICNYVSTRLEELGSDVYNNYDSPGKPFGNFGLEEQAAIVDQWFAGTRQGIAGGRPPGTGQPMDLNDPYFIYIANNIWLGVA